MTPKYLVVHTAAFQGRNCDAKRIDQWHRQRGWNGIGYHYVILNDKHDTKPDGTVEAGRSENISGAHAYGINSKSLGICCVGHGDFQDFTSAQYESLYELLEDLCDRYSIPVKNVIGHRELNTLISQGELDRKYRTDKSCPGKKVDMEKIRATLEEKLSPTSNLTADSQLKELSENKQIVDAILLLKEHRNNFGNSRDELNHFLFHPEIIEITES